MGKTQTSDAAVLAVRFEARMWREASTGTREERQEDGSYKDVEIAFPAEWAVYDVESGVRLAYSKSEEGAKKAAEKWNDGKIPELIANKAESARDLKKSYSNPAIPSPQSCAALAGRECRAGSLA